MRKMISELMFVMPLAGRVVGLGAGGKGQFCGGLIVKGSFSTWPGV